MAERKLTPRGEFDKALDHYQRSKEKFEATGNLKGVATALLNSSEVYYLMADFAKTLEIAGQAAVTTVRAGEMDIYRRVCQAMDQVVLATVLRHVKGNQVKASELLGISRTTLRAKLRALRLGGDKLSPGEAGESEKNDLGS